MFQIFQVVDGFGSGHSAVEVLAHQTGKNIYLFTRLCAQGHFHVKTAPQQVEMAPGVSTYFWSGRFCKMGGVTGCLSVGLSL